MPDLDLTGGVGSLANLRPGQNIGTDLYAEVENAGTGTAPGTIGSLDPANGYMVDFVLSTDPWPPIRIARYSERFHDGVLLKGGRSSRTVDLAPGDAKTYSDSTAVMPIAIKPGNYFLCAVVDPHDRVRELNEHNNTQCVEISVKGP